MEWITSWTIKSEIALSIPGFSGLSGETLNWGPFCDDLIFGGTLNPSSLTHPTLAQFSSAIYQGIHVSP